MARPSKLTQETAAVIIASIQVGAFANAAAEAAGIAESTFYAWLQRGEAAQAALDRGQPVSPEEGRFLEFSQAIARASAEAEVAAANLLFEAASADWRAAVAWLERRHPARWRPTAKVQHGPDERLLSLLAACTTVGEAPPDHGDISIEPGAHHPEHVASDDRR
jgi:hypothetical protein